MKLHAMIRAFAFVFTAIIVINCSYATSDKIDSEIRPDLDGLIFLAERLQGTHPDSSLSIARNAYNMSSRYDYLPGKAKSCLLMGNLLYEMGGLSPALSQLNEALKLYTALNNKSRMAEVNILLGRVHQRSENYPQAFLYQYTALQIYESLEMDLGRAKVFGHIGHLFEKTQSYDSALMYQKKAMDFYSIAGDTLGLASIHNNVGSIYEDLAQYEKAFNHFQIALLLNRSIGNDSEVIVNLNNLGDIYRKQDDFKNGLKYTEEALFLAEAAKLDYQVKSACRDLSKLYNNFHQLDKAFYYLERSYTLTDQIFSDQIASEIAKTHAIYQLESKQQRILLLEKERRFNRSIMMLSSLGICIFFLLGVLIFYQQKSKNTKKRKLLETKAELDKAELANAQLNEQNLKTELENKLLKEEQLQQELELKSKSLTKSALQMIQKNEFLNDLRKKLNEVKKGKVDLTDKRIKKLIKSIDFNFNIDDDWQEFETIFQQVHSEFFRKLKEMYPDLSPSEVRLCAMIRLNLHSKDMAAIMGISQDSLRIARYRLRKRLGLNKGSNLYSFIINIG